MLSHKLKILSLLLVAGLLAISVIVWQKYPFGVKQYKTIILGMQAAQGAGTPTIWAPPYRTVLESLFYVYAIGDEHKC